MREVNIKVVDKGPVHRVRECLMDTLIDVIYPATRFEPGEQDERGTPGTSVYYVWRDERGDRVGMYEDVGAIIKEV